MSKERRSSRLSAPISLTHFCSCVYCRRSATEVSFVKKEHVIPASFGKFHANFTLKDTVCDDCNQFFGDTLELSLSRDSIEGLFRYRFGLKSADSYQPMKSSRLRYEFLEGPYKGFPAKMTFDGSPTPNVSPKPCIRISETNGENSMYFSPAELPTAKEFLSSIGKKKAELLT